MDRRASKAVASFCAGFFMTMLLVVAVPVIVEDHITPLIEDAVGESTFLTLSSSFIVSALAWAVMFGIMAVLGSGGVMRWFGLSGIAGLVVAYYVLGDVTRAVVPLLSLAAVSLAFWIHRKNREKRDGSRGKRPERDDIPDRCHSLYPAEKSVLYPMDLTLFADGLGCCSHYVFLLFRRHSAVSEIRSLLLISGVGLGISLAFEQRIMIRVRIIRIRRFKNGSQRALIVA